MSRERQRGYNFEANRGQRTPYSHFEGGHEQQHGSGNTHEGVSEIEWTAHTQEDRPRFPLNSWFVAQCSQPTTVFVDPREVGLTPMAQAHREASMCHGPFRRQVLEEQITDEPAVHHHHHRPSQEWLNGYQSQAGYGIPPALFSRPPMFYPQVAADPCHFRALHRPPAFPQYFDQSSLAVGAPLGSYMYPTVPMMHSYPEVPELAGSTGNAVRILSSQQPNLGESSPVSPSSMKRKREIDAGTLLEDQTDPCKKKRAWSAALQERIMREGPGFVDEIGYGTWTNELNPDDPDERALIVELLNGLYNRPHEGFFIREVFGGTRWGTSEICDAHLEELLLLARHRIAAFAVRRRDDPTQYDTCFDTPDVYESIPNYFDYSARNRMSLNGTGGGRKLKTGSPRDFFQDIHYFKSKARAVRELSEIPISVPSRPDSESSPFQCRSPTHEEDSPERGR